MEKLIIEKIKKHSNEIIEFGNYIWNHAEMGYKEYETAKYFADFARSQGLRVEEGLAITGVKAYLGEYDPSKVTLAIIGELDALPYPNHPNANPKTGAAHFCGHNSQMAGMMGALIGLNQKEVLDSIDGNLVFFAVPAEEFVEVEFKNKLMNEGKIEFGGGKCELIRIGAFDDIDVAIGQHLNTNQDYGLYNCTYNGFVNKIVNFRGKTTHAAGSPHLGVDALKAAVLASIAIEQQQEFYKDEDSVRVHGFMPKAGEAMNIVCDHSTLEYSIRANNIPAFMQASKRFDRAVKGGALANGCDVEIITLPGYLPSVSNKEVTSITKALDYIDTLYPDYVRKDISRHQTGSTDYGDLSNIMPVLQFTTGGYLGQLHNSDLIVVDPYLAYVVNAQIFALTTYYLTSKNNGDIKNVVNNFKPIFTKESYIKYMRETKKIENFNYMEEI